MFRCARCASPSSASSAGSCTRPTEYGAGLWRTLWEAGQPLGLRPAAIARSTRCVWRRATALGGGHHAGRDTARGGARVLRAKDKDFLGSARGAQRGPLRRPPALPGARRSARGGRRQRAGAHRRAGGRARDERRVRLHGRALDRLRLPAGRRRDRDRGRDRHLRRVDRGRGGGRAAVRPHGIADSR